LKAVECLSDEPPETLAGALGGLAQYRLELGEGLLNGIEVRAVGRQVDEPSALRCDRLDNAGGFVTGQNCRA
jgi:hypothetical protein